MTTTPVAIRIHESLDLAFASKRLVFWYDAAGEWADVFDSYAGKDLQKRRVEGNEFASKVLISGTVRPLNLETRIAVITSFTSPSKGLQDQRRQIRAISWWQEETGVNYLGGPRLICGQLAGN
ncbi:MAG: hypothetical protein ACOYLI_08365 [Synechococcus lacustris]